MYIFGGLEYEVVAVRFVASSMRDMSQSRRKLWLTLKVHWGKLPLTTGRATGCLCHRSKPIGRHTQLTNRCLSMTKATSGHDGGQQKFSLMYHRLNTSFITSYEMSTVISGCGHFVHSQNITCSLAVWYFVSSKIRQIICF